MNRLTILLVLLGFSLTSHAFKDEKLNALYEQLQQQTQSKQLLNTQALVVYLVGNAGDAACQYNSIKDAITAANSNSSNSYEIRVAYNKTYTENLLIYGRNQTLKGGYANCTDASNNNSVGTSKTNIDASTAALPAIIVRNPSGFSHVINIYNFDISGGTGIASAPAGGINIQDDNIEVHIENSFIHSNTGINGGGVYVEGGSNDLYLKDSLVFLNDASNGGGLYCDAADVFVYGDSGFSVNNAIGTFLDGSGGGVYLTNSCGFNLFSGTAGGFLDFRGIAANTANRDGGGIYANMGAQVLLMGYLFVGEFGNNDQPVNITGNKANNSASTRLGGGLYVTGATTNVMAYATIINNNETLNGITSTAGAMYIDEANFSLGKLNSPCWDEQKCNQISGNKVNSVNGTNAGIMALSGASVDIRNTWISGQSSSDNVFLFGQYINAVIEGNVFTANGGASIDGNNSLLYFYGSASGGLSVAYNTFVNNEISNSLFRINEAPDLLVFGNIIKESNNVAVLDVNGGSSASTVFDCMITHEDSSFNGTSVFVDDPEFIDEANDNFHISATSPAIDLCDGTYAATTKDLDSQDRAWDDLLTDNVDGANDAGVDEFYPDTTADLSVTKTLLTSAPYYVGETVNYSIIVTNNGSDAATNVTITDTPSGMTISNVQSTNCSGFPCVIPSLANGAHQVISVTARLRLFAGLFDNSVTVYSQDYDPDSSDNTDNTGNGGTAIKDHADMAVDFSISTAAPYHSGQTVTYQATITNNGPDTARNVMISGINYLNTELLNTVGAPCTQLPCHIAAFASGATVNLTLSVKINTGGSFRYGVNVTTDSTDDDSSNNLGTVDNLAAQNSGDLEIVSQLITAPNYIVGQTVEIRLVVTNNGPEGIGSIEVSALLNNLTIESVSGAGCTSMPCSNLSLISGDDLTITLLATILNFGDFSLDATVDSSNSFDPHEPNNESGIMGLAIEDHVDMAVDFSISTAAPYHSGQTVTYQATITNNGPDTARNVMISGINYLNTELLNTVGAPCTQLPCHIAAFASGDTVNLTLSVKINTGGSFRYGVNVTTDSTDDDSSNNLGTVDNLAAQNSGDLEITAQLVTAPTYTQGQTVEISLLVANNGPDLIGSIEASAVLNNLTIDSVSGVGCSSLPCTNLMLANGDDLTITVMATIVNTGTFALTASALSSNSYDFDLTTNESTVTNTATVFVDAIFANSFED